MSSESLAETLRQLLPEPNEEITAAIESVARLEHEHTAAAEQAELERAFLQRAPREGLLYPGDALKLDDVTQKLRESGDREQALQELYASLRSDRPYLFAKAPGSPATQKLSVETTSPKLTHGNLTRQVQELRRKNR